MSPENILTLMLVALLGMTAVPTTSAVSCASVYEGIAEATVEEVEARLFELACPPSVPPAPDAPDEGDLREACEDADAYVRWVDNQFPQFVLRGLPCHYL